MANSKKYWQGFEDLVESPLAQKFQQNEFSEDLPSDEFLGNDAALGSSQTTRRDFLKYLGFSTAAATLAACEAPIVESIPYVVKPDSLTPGMPTYYASTFFDGYDFAPVLVKTREGRPIKLEPNDMATFNKGTNARVQGSVLSLYDSERLRQPMINGAEATWSSAIADLKAALDGAGNKQIVFMTPTVISPSTKKIISELKAKYPNLKHVQYDAVSVSKKLDIYERILGERSMPRYRFDKAELVVSLASDFLGDWNGQDVSADYAMSRKPGKNMMRHIQMESNLSITGSNADKRIKLKPSEYGHAAIYLAKKIAKATGHSAAYSGGDVNGELASQLDGIATELLAKPGKSMFLVGGNDKDLEHFAIAINMMLRNGDETIDLADRVYLRQGNDEAVAEALKDMAAGNVGVLMTAGLNPTHTLPGFEAAATKVETRVSMTDRMDETAAGMTMILPMNHFLESWGDFLPKRKYYTISQPTISPLFDTMQMEDVLLKLADSDVSYRKYLQNFYETTVMPKTPENNWITAVQNGVIEKDERDLDYFIIESEVFSMPNLMETLMGALVKSSDKIRGQKVGKHEIVFYQKAGMGSGNMANNPWLQELPDPVSRLSWDNYLTMAAADAKELGFEQWHETNGAMNGNYANLTVGGVTLENVPVFIQAGQTIGTIGLSVGYGRTAAGKAANGVGVNAYTLMGDMAQWNTDVTIENVGGEHHFATIQMGHTMMGRKIVNEVTLA